MSTKTLPEIAPSFEVYFSELHIQLSPAVPMTQEQFFDFCQQNRQLRFERTAQGELIIMAPSGGDSGFREAEVTRQLGNWAKAVGKGKVSGSSGGFILPSGANRGPEAAWVSPEQLALITAEQRKKFLPLCPFFLIEVMSPSDDLIKLQKKMDEYLANGCQLGWLLDPAELRAYIYRPSRPVEELDNPQTLAGDPELLGFVLDLEPVWRP